MSIVKQERTLISRRNALRKQLSAVETELSKVGQIKSGDLPSADQAKRMKIAKSFGVHFERRKALRKVASPGAVCKSVRRFGSVKEANQHGRRFTRKHNHKGYRIVTVAKRPNAWINWRTGKTNPVLNRR